MCDLPVLNKSLDIPYNQSMTGNANCLGGIGHSRMKNIFPIFTQPLACGDRKEDDSVLFPVFATT